MKQQNNDFVQNVRTKNVHSPGITGYLYIMKQTITLYFNSDDHKFCCMLININGVEHSASDMRIEYGQPDMIQVVTSKGSHAADEFSMKSVMDDGMRFEDPIFYSKEIEVEIVDQETVHYTYTILRSEEFRSVDWSRI